MTTLEIMVGKKDFLTAQEVLSRIHFKDNILVSQNRRAAVYRILIEEDRMASVIQELRQSIKSFSLCAVSKDETDFLPRKTESDQPETYAFRALNVPVKDGELIMRRMFGFKTFDE
ncbi:MAG: hypothetical protein PUE61_03830 [Clostridiales bacterium]|nr:hypothetical protein [Clostridiales bacterium]